MKRYIRTIEELNYERDRKKGYFQGYEDGYYRGMQNMVLYSIERKFDDGIIPEWIVDRIGQTYNCGHLARWCKQIFSVDSLYDIDWESGPEPKTTMLRKHHVISKNL